jgi:hypothetical protein
MTNQQLKDLLKLRDLPVSGKKADLIARLETYSGRPKPSKKWANSQAKKDLKKALLDLNHPFYSMTPDAVHNSHDKYRQYPLFKEYFVEMKKRVAEEKERVKMDDSMAKEHLSSFPRAAINKRGYPHWDSHAAQQWLQVDVANGLHKTMKPRKLRKTRECYKEFPKDVFAKRVHAEIARQKAAGFWADKRNKKGMKRYLQDVQARANAQL